MTGRCARAGGLAPVFYVLLFEFLAGTRWAGFPRILLYIFPVTAPGVCCWKNLAEQPDRCSCPRSNIDYRSMQGIRA